MAQVNYPLESEQALRDCLHEYWELVRECARHIHELDGWDRTFIGDLSTRQNKQHLSPSQWENLFRIWVTVTGRVKFPKQQEPEEPQNYDGWLAGIQNEMMRDPDANALNMSDLPSAIQKHINDWARRTLPSYALLKYAITNEKAKQAREQYREKRQIVYEEWKHFDDFERTAKQGRELQKGPVKARRF